MKDKSMLIKLEQSINYNIEQHADAMGSGRWDVCFACYDLID